VWDRREKSINSLIHILMKLSSGRGRKLVIWISPGWAPRPGTYNEPIKDLQDRFSYIVSISTVLRQAEVTIYSIDPHGADPMFGLDLNTSYKKFLKGAESWQKAEDTGLMLQVIAAQTGGLVLFGSNNFAGMIDQCVSDAQAFYEVTYSAPHARQAYEYHAVEVKVDKPGLTTRERMGYYAQP
jgi:VWFA-related protein